MKDIIIKSLELINPLSAALKQWLTVHPKERNLLLKEMKNTGHPEAGNIIIEQTHSTKAGLSQGECL